MALKAKHKEIEFGIGDQVKVFQKIKEGEKERLQAFEGTVLGIKGRGANKSFTVRRIGVQQIGIERIFPLSSPSIEKIEVVREGMKGTRRAKLYYIRNKPKKEIEKIYSRAVKRSQKPKASPKRVKKSPSRKKSTPKKK